MNTYQRILKYHSLFYKKVSPNHPDHHKPVMRIRMHSLLKISCVLLTLFLLAEGNWKALPSNYEEYDDTYYNDKEATEDLDMPSEAEDYDNNIPSEELQYNEQPLLDDTDNENDMQEEKITGAQSTFCSCACPHIKKIFGQITQWCGSTYTADYPCDCDKNHTTREINMLLGRLKRKCKSSYNKILIEILNCMMPKSCAEVGIVSSAESGYYNITVNGERREVYCLMEKRCNKDGPWMLLSEFNQTMNCPNALATVRVHGRKLCPRRYNLWAGCASIKMNTGGVKYSEVCGRVTGYQRGSPDAFHELRSIDGPYLDGVSITQGRRRKHIWSLAAGYNEIFKTITTCPCNKGNHAKPPKYVGHNYYCESAINKWYWIGSCTYMMNDKLWDGRRFRQNEWRCRKDMMPWFYRKLSQTSDYIEMRVCTDEGTYNENIGVDEFKFYIK